MEHSNGRVIWITGLSGAGKSTLALEIKEQMRNRGKKVLMLDGDELREVFGMSGFNKKNHSQESRLALAMQYSRLCKIIAEQGFIVIIATISLFKEVHEWNHNNLLGYVEVYIRVPMKELKRRDPKGIYRRFDDGELTDVTGMDLDFDEPEKPDWVIDFDTKNTPVTLANMLIKKFFKE